MFKDFTSYQKAAIVATKSIVKNELSRYKDWKGINLHPALERHFMIWFIKNYKDLNGVLYKKEKVWINFEKHYLQKQGFIKNFISDSFILNTIKDLYYNFHFSKRLNTKCELAIFVHHPKFSRILENYNLGLNNKNIIWIALARFKEIKKTLPKDAIVLNQPIGKESKKDHPRFIKEVLDTTFKIEKILDALNPEITLSFEGNAPYQLILASICKKRKITSACLQWGLINEFWKDIGF